MSLCRSIPVVRTAANRGISIRTVSAARACRNFQTSSICSNKPKDHEGKSSRKTSDERLNDEIKKLKEMRESFRDSGFLEKFKLRDQLQKQETKVAETQSFKKIDEDVKPPIIKFGESDPLKADVAERYAVVYKYMLGSFLIQCSKSTSLFVDPDDVIQETITSFEETYPYLTAITKEEVLSLTHLYYALSNNIVYLDDLKIENPVVTELLQEYLKFVDNSEDSSLDAFPSKEIAVKHNVEKAVVVNWFKTFDIWNECPYSDENFRYTNILCPFEYSQYEGVKNELKRVADELTMNKKGDQPNAFGNFTFNTSNENKSKNSEKSSEKKKEDDKNKSFYEVEFNIPPAAKFFQIGVLGGLLIYILYSNNSSNEHEITFQEFVTKFLSKGLVSKIVVVNNRVAIVELNENGKNQMNYYGNYSFTIGSVESFERSLREAQDEYNISDSMRIPVVFTSEGGMSKLLINFVPTFIFLGAIYYMTKKAGGMGGMGGPLGFGKSSAKKFNSEAEVKVRFKDVAGMSEAKEEVMEFVKFLKNPTKYEHLGAKIPRGAILSGPPGTGKTLIARATAGEAGVPFYSVSGSEFVEMFVGVGASRVRDLFKTARENAPSIIFIDEIDAIGKQRSKGNASGANDERETTLNQLLVEMDGFDTSDHVVVLAGTNRADILDKALMRPGRFDRHITIDNPELEGRKEIFEVHLKKITLSPDIDAQLSGRLAALTPGFSGADIANVCNEAALIAARYNAESVTLRHFELAIERVIGGIEKKSKILNPEEQRIVAYHEAGHAICGWYLRYANPLLKVSIIPRGQGALGYAQYLPPDQYLMNTFQLSDRMIMTLGGRVSEQLHFASVTSGAHDDFKKVTNIARSMVLRFGMSPKVGMVNYADAKTSDDLTKPFSDQTNRTIDEEIQRIVKESYDKCTALLKEKAAEVELVAQELLRKEFITREDMIRLLGKRPFPETNDAFDKYLDGKAAYSNEVPVNEKKDSEIEEERKHTEQEEEKANKKEA